MANVEHSALTGSDLHEPKGVAAAAANKVYVSDGAASGSWTTVTNSTLSAEAKAFQAGLLHVRDQRAANTAGDSITSGAWRTRTLQTVVTNEITSASLASNQITLPAGTYFIDAEIVSGWATHATVVKLRNVTDGADTIIGTVNRSNATGGYAQTTLSVKGRFTIAGSKAFEIQQQVGVSTNAQQANMGVVEVYADVLIWKVA